MFKFVMSLAVVSAIGYFLLAMSPDFYDIIYYREAPKDICETVDVGMGLFKVYGCECDCKINYTYIFYLFGAVLGISLSFFLGWYIIIATIFLIIKKLFGIFITDDSSP
jgi:hypothetical protein